MSEPAAINQALRESIRGLYATFAKYRFDRTEEDDPLERDRIFEDLSSAPLRELPAAALKRFSERAMSTWGTRDEFKHFLPRMLEIVATEADSLDPNYIFSKIAYSGFSRLDEYVLYRPWPEHEQRAVTEYATAVWNGPALSAQDPDEWPSLYTCLQAFGVAFDDIGPFLNTWAASTNPGAAGQFAQWVEYELKAQHHLRRERIAGLPWWSGRQHVAEQARRWFLEPERASWLESFFFRQPDAPWAEKISIAVSQHEWIRAAVQPH